MDTKKYARNGGEERLIGPTIVGFVVPEEKLVVMACDGRATEFQTEIVKSDELVKTHRLGDRLLVATSGFVELGDQVEELLRERVKQFDGPISQLQIETLKTEINMFLKGKEDDNKKDASEFGLMLAGVDDGGNSRLWKYENGDLVEQNGFSCIGPGAGFAKMEADRKLQVGMCRTEVIDLAFKSIYRAAMNCVCTGGRVSAVVLGGEGFDNFETSIKGLADFYWVLEPGEILGVGLVFDWTPLRRVPEADILRFLKWIRIKEKGNEEAPESEEEDSEASSNEDEDPED